MHCQVISFLRAIAIVTRRLSVCPSVRPSVCHTRQLYQNGARWDHEIFTEDCNKDFSFVWLNFVLARGEFTSNEIVKEG